MATTTNYSWTTPDDTALVKDGASAIRTLGSSVDTTLKNLNPSTTLGDIEYRSSSANVNTRLPIGTTGQILTVTGGVPSWSTPASSTSGLTLISSVSVSNASAWNTGTVFSSTYTNYKIVMYGTGTGTNDAIYVFPRVSGSNNTSGGCSYATDGKCTDGSRVELINTNQNYFLFPYYGTPGNLYDLTISQPFASEKTFLVGNSIGTNGATTAFGTVNHAGWTSQTTSYDSLGFTVSGGTFTGVIKIYGLAN